jgi:hypothetical protein
MVCSTENFQENNKMFTYEWLGTPTESGIRPVLQRRSLQSTNSLKAAVAYAQTELKKKEVFARGQQTYGIRIFNNDSILVWTGNIDDA